MTTFPYYYYGGGGGGGAGSGGDGGGGGGGSSNLQGANGFMGNRVAGVQGGAGDGNKPGSGGSGGVNSGTGGPGGAGGQGAPGARGGDGGNGAPGGGAILLGARGLLRFTGQVNISAGLRTLGADGASGATAGGAGAAGASGGGQGYGGAGGGQGAAYGGDGGEGGKGGRGSDGGRGGNGGRGGDGGYGTPGMLKLQGSVILTSEGATHGRVIADNVFNNMFTRNGRVTLISNLRQPSAHYPLVGGTDPNANPVFGATRNDPILRGLNSFDALPHPMIGELVGGVNTEGVLRSGFWNADQVVPPGAYRVELVRLSGSASPFADYDQVFIVNNSAGPVEEVILQVDGGAMVLVPGTGAPGVLQAGEIFTTTVASGSLVNIHTSIVYDPLTDRAVHVGEDVVFTLNADGGGVLEYQWQVDTGSGFVDMLGENGDELVIPSVTAAMRGNRYRCLIHDNTHSAYTNVGTLDVLLTVTGPTPSMARIYELESIALTVVADGGDGNYGYQWYKNGESLEDGGTLSGTDTPMLVITGAALEDAGTYVCEVTDSGPIPSVLTDPAVLEVYEPLSALIAQAAFRGLLGERTSIHVVQSGGIPPVLYAWERDTGTGFVPLVNGAPIFDADTDTLSIDPVAGAYDGHLFRSVVQDAGSDISGITTITTDEARLYVGPPPTITAHPGNMLAYTTEPPFSLSGTFEDGVGEIQCMWLQRNVDSGEVTEFAPFVPTGPIVSVIITPSALAVGNYEYFFRISDTVTRAEGVLIESNPGSIQINYPLAVVYGPQDRLAYLDSPEFDLVGEYRGGVGDILVSWYRHERSQASPELLDEFQPVGNTLYFTVNPTLTGPGEYDYYFRVSDVKSRDSGVLIQSPKAYVEIDDHFSFTMLTPGAVPDGTGGYLLDFPVGDSLVLTMDVQGGLGDIAKQWQKDDARKAFENLTEGSGISGVTGNTLVITPAMIEDSGVYRLETSDFYETHHSPLIHVTVAYGVPVAGIAGFGALAAMLAMVGALRRRRRQ